MHIDFDLMMNSHIYDTYITLFPFLLYIKSFPFVTGKPGFPASQSAVSVSQGGTAVLNCSAIGYPTPTTQWYQGDTVILVG